MGVFAPTDIVFKSPWSWEFSIVFLREKTKDIKQQVLCVEQCRKLGKRNAGWFALVTGRRCRDGLRVKHRREEKAWVGPI